MNKFFYRGMQGSERPINLDILPFESWGKLAGESSAAFDAFCSYRDYGPDRNIKKVLASIESDPSKANKKYRTWRNWSALFCWNKRAADYDKHLDKLRLTERRKTIEAREEAHKQITEKMLAVVNKKLDIMSAEELSQGNVTEWVKTAIQAEREILGISKEESSCKAGGSGQLEINFDKEFDGL